jgi:hypothetical protein
MFIEVNIRQANKGAQRMMTTTVTNTSTMTVRQLRAILFELVDQQMTIEKLRKKLYDVEEQDKAVEINTTFWWKQGIE